MARRKKRKSPSITRYIRSIFAVAGLVTYLGYEAYSLAGVAPGRQAKIFSAYADLNLKPNQIARMRESPIPPAQKPPSAPWRTITRVVDGDSVEVDGHKIRLIGIDTPESSENNEFFRDLGKMNGAAQKHELLALGKEATRAARRLAQGKRCWLEFEQERIDQYGRTLAYVHLDDGTILNEEMLRQGYAKVYMSFNFPYKKRYIHLQFAAMTRRVGFWKGEENEQ